VLNLAAVATSRAAAAASAADDGVEVDVDISTSSSTAAIAAVVPIDASAICVVCAAITPSAEVSEMSAESREVDATTVDTSATASEAIDTALHLGVAAAPDIASTDANFNGAPGNFVLTMDSEEPTWNAVSCITSATAAPISTRTSATRNFHLHYNNVFKFAKTASVYADEHDFYLCYFNCYCQLLQVQRFCRKSPIFHGITIIRFF
jgi:hypothetical protein